jgi:hypothetical protein
MSRREALFEFIPCDDGNAPTLPEKSRRALQFLDTPRASARRLLVERGVDGEYFDGEWPRHLDAWLFDLTAVAADFLATHMREATARESGLILSLN